MSDNMRISTSMRVAIKLYKELFNNELTPFLSDAEIINAICRLWLTDNFTDYQLFYAGLPRLHVKPVPVEAVGLCDDPYCSFCHEDVSDGHPAICPNCKAPLDWRHYDKFFGDDERSHE